MIYLIYGEERYLVNKRLEEIKLEYEDSYAPLSMGLNYIVLDNLKDIDELISEIEFPPFGYDNKLIIVRGSNLFSKSEDNKIYTNKILEYLKNNTNILKSATIVFIEYEFKENDLSKYIKKIGEVKEYKILTKKDNLQIMKILEEYISDFNKTNNKKIKISKFDLNYFIEEVGRDLYTLINNLDKLLYYKYDSNSIDKSDIDSIVVKSTESVIFDISNNILSGNYNNIITAINNLIYSGNDIYTILGYVYGIYRNMYLMVVAEENGANPKLVLPERQAFLVPKYLRYIRKIGRKKLEQILYEIMEIDRLSKLNEIDAELAIKAILR